MAHKPLRLKNPIDPTYLDQNVNDSSVRMDSDKAVSIQKVVLVDTSSNPSLDINDANPLITQQATNAKYDSASGTAAGSTATTATFLQVNEVMVTGIAVVTGGATTIIVKGTTSGKILATITLPTLAVALAFPAMVFYPNIALTGETVTLTLSANYTSGTVSVNVYGN